MVVWIKTDAGRAEMQARALVKERPRRNLLLLVDGARTEQMLLDQVAGITPGDFLVLESLGLIVSTDAGRAPGRDPALERTVPMQVRDPGPPTEAPATVPSRQAPEDYAGFTAALSQMISKQLGLRGFTLVLAVEKASTPQELMEVAERVIAAIRERKGDAAADMARATLFGG
jgi:hypothetical protein